MAKLTCDISMSLDGFTDHLDPVPIELEITRVVESPNVTHLRYRVVR